MSRAQHKDVEPPATEPETESPGKVVVDARGHSVWQWAKDVLENKDLALESTQKVPIVSGAQPGEKGASPHAPKSADSNAKAAKEAATKSRVWHPAMQPVEGADRGGGFDPYNSRK